MLTTKNSFELNACVAALCTLAAQFLLIACTATGDDYVKWQTPAYVPNAVHGVLRAEEYRLLGPDANQNGIRDGIDLLIRTETKDIALQSAAMAYAKKVTEAVLAGSRTGGSTPNLRDDLERAEACLDEAAGSSSLSKKLKAAIVDTPERMAAMERWTRTISTERLLQAKSCP